jgi:hypothetical protein
MASSIVVTVGNTVSTVTLNKSDAEVAAVLSWFIAEWASPVPEALTPAQQKQYQLDQVTARIVEMIRIMAKGVRMRELIAEQASVEAAAERDVAICEEDWDDSERSGVSERDDCGGSCEFCAGGGFGFGFLLVGGAIRGLVMMTLPGRVSVATARLVALLELAGWGARSEAERRLVVEVRRELEQAMRGQDEGDHGGAASGATGAQSTGAGDSDGGSAGTNTHGTFIGVVRGGEQ